MPDDCEARDDFWSIEGNYIYRHHVEPRVKLCVSLEESFPTPLRYVDVTMTAHTTLDVLQENRMDDFGTLMRIEINHEFIPMHQAMEILDAQAAVDKEKFPAWQKAKV